jgi:hypothetical protein
MKKLPFFVGLLSGLALAQTWKPLMKEGIKASIWAGRKVKEVSQQALEDLQDVTAEAVEETAQQPQAKKDNS